MLRNRIKYLIMIFASIPTTSLEKIAPTSWAPQAIALLTKSKTSSASRIFSNIALISREVLVIPKKKLWYQLSGARRHEDH